ETKIRECIEERCDRIVTNQKLMLNSILERPTRKIKIDRVCEDVGDNFKLYTEEKEVLDQEQALSTSHSNSAPGISGITYPVLRRLGKYTTIFCIRLLSECLASGKIPQKWK
ncbi:17481_t:CDS:2, partial [Gigaspora rosea]